MLDRRQLLTTLASAGIGTTVFQRALAAQVVTHGNVTVEMIQNAEWIAGLELTEEEREQTAHGVRRSLAKTAVLQAVEIDYFTPPAFIFRPEMGAHPAESADRGEVQMIESASLEKPNTPEDLAFLPVTKLATLIRERKVSSTELTTLYLDRLHQHQPKLNCVISFLDDLALKQAANADREISAGRYRGPLHGIPWGAKDLIAYPGYNTTWGAPQFKDQKLDMKATVAQRLDDAGAVLIAKLSLGAVAMGDDWFGGKTRNPWNTEEGSSGSSAGSASATAAGCVGFSIGSETTGSITSPCRRCGVTGLRPTFGRVSRFGCMPLAWSLDKLGPIARSVEDCALILDFIRGRDGLDPTVVDRPFSWPFEENLQTLRVGYVETGLPTEERTEIRTLRELGVQLIPIELPTKNLPVSALTLILDVESADIFEPLIKSGDTEGLNAWPATWHQAYFISATQYVRANRVRTLVMQTMEKAMQDVDAYVGGDDIVLANYTGHPTISIPGSFIERNGANVPTAVTFTGQLFGETTLLALAHAFQQTTDHHLQRPPLSNS